MSTYPTRQPITSANFEDAFARVFGGRPDVQIADAPRTARVRVNVKPAETHRRAVTPQFMANWMHDHPAATRAEMLLEFTENELANHFDEARRIWSRTTIAA